jgi:hypothetical protein
MVARIFEFAGTIGIGGAADNTTVLRILGRSIGRIVYFLDSIIDYRADLRSRRFNPLYACSAHRAHHASNIPEAARQEVLDVLEEELSTIRHLLGELVLPRYRRILESFVILNVEHMLALVRDAQEGQLEKAASVWSLGFSYHTTPDTDCCGKPTGGHTTTKQDDCTCC